MWAYDQVREQILSGHLTPGSRVSQVQLAAGLGLSRPPLREALRMLQNEGLVQAERNRQVRIAPLDLDDLDQLFALRIAVEPLAVRVSVPFLAEAELDVIAELGERHTRERTQHCFGDAEKTHLAFHSALFAHAGERMTRLAVELWQSAERYRKALWRESGDLNSMIELTSRDHSAIVSAARARDAAGCADMVEEHISKSGLIIFSLIDSSREPRLLRAARRTTSDRQPLLDGDFRRVLSR